MPRCGTRHRSRGPSSPASPVPCFARAVILDCQNGAYARRTRRAASRTSSGSREHPTHHARSHRHPRATSRRTLGRRPPRRVRGADRPGARGHLRPHRAVRQRRPVAAGDPPGDRALDPGLLPLLPVEGRAVPAPARRRPPPHPRLPRAPHATGIHAGGSRAGLDRRRARTGRQRAGGVADAAVRRQPGTARRGVPRRAAGLGRSAHRPARGRDRACSRPATDARRDAVAIYRLAFATLQHHLVHGTRPNARETDHVVGFCLRGVGVG